MLLNERKIKKHIIKQQLKENSIKEVDFRYNKHKKDVLMDTKGIGSIIHEEEFYENLYEDVLSVDSFCIARLAKRFNSNMKISTTVLPDGCMDFSSVSVSVNITVPNKQDILNENTEKVKIRGFLYSQYKKLVPFYQYIKSIEFIYQNYRLCNVTVDMELDLDKVNSLFETNAFNSQILEQWLATYEVIHEQSADEHSIYFKLPIIKGQMRFDMREECMRARYEYEREEV
ncbi:hypothetical protein [Alkalihalobacillus sp. BA299]|uniref:hypothetical protein n=1 Tax=Alkalihalobacillus sp. BA299 TaxID=2815938 RepID=UPI001ADAF8A0|nr:hypothetical protein [Alkalihalobacillus sp. BA299]